MEHIDDINVHSSDSDNEVDSQNGGPQNEPPEEIEIEQVGRDRPPEPESSSEEEESSQERRKDRAEMKELIKEQQKQTTIMLKVFNTGRKPKFEPLKEEALTQDKLQVFLRNVQADCTRERRNFIESVRFLGEQLSGVTLECFNAIHENAQDFDELKDKLMVRRFGPQDRDTRRRKMKNIVFKEGKETGVEYWRRKEEAIKYWDRNADTESFLDEMLDGLKEWKRHDTLKLEVKRYKRDRVHGQELMEKTKECFLDMLDDEETNKSSEVQLIQAKYSGTCFVCGRTGHKAVDCREKLPQKHFQKHDRHQNTPGHWNSLLKQNGRGEKSRHEERREDRNSKMPWKNWRSEPEMKIDRDRIHSIDDRKPAEKRAHENSGSKCNNCKLEGHWWMHCPFVDTRKTGGKLILKTAEGSNFKKNRVSYEDRNGSRP